MVSWEREIPKELRGSPPTLVGLERLGLWDQVPDLCRIAPPRAWAKFKGWPDPLAYTRRSTGRGNGRTPEPVERESVRESQGLGNYEMVRASLRWCHGWRGRGLSCCVRVPTNLQKNNVDS